MNWKEKFNRNFKAGDRVKCKTNPNFKTYGFGHPFHTENDDAVTLTRLFINESIGKWWSVKESDNYAVLEEDCRKV